MTELTKQEDWSQFWAKLELPALVDEQGTFEKILIEVFNNELLQGQSVYEIGCAPGKWLIFASQHFNCSVGGCEYQVAAFEKTKENLALCNIDHSNIVRSDIKDISTEKTYDVVYSLGFIEHFSNPDEILKKHVDLLSMHGKLIISVPHFRGLHGILLRFQDFFNRKNKLIQKHNLNVMVPQYFKQIGEKHGLKTKYVKYLGGFEPAFFAPDQLDIFSGTILKLKLKLCKLLFGNMKNHSFTSSFLLGVFEKE
jgi:cyclopropane fatty-acyl-phospholipid synthase-like methyltransferase